MLPFIVGVVLAASASASAAPEDPSPPPLTPADPTRVDPARADVSRQELARQWFEAGISLARAGRYGAAKAMFLEAYAAQPHPLVLYNIAQADLQLGELGAAAEFLRRYLAESGATISMDQRRDVEVEIMRIDAERAQQLEAETKRAPALEVARQEAGEPDPPVASARPAAHLQQRRAPVWAQALTGVGAAALAGSVGLYLWNDHRYEQWQTEGRSLAALDARVARGEADPEAEALQQRAAAHDARLDSIGRIDVVTWVVAGAGVASLGTGLYALIRGASDASTSTEPTLSLGPSELSFGARWLF